MDDIKKELTDALVMLGRIALAGDALDVMAAAKHKVRRAIAILEQEEVKPDGR